MTSEDEWRPTPVNAAQTQFKWGYDQETGKVAFWEVGGPGDGLPTHNDYLLREWGREPEPGARDRLGIVISDGDTLRIATFYGASVPPALVDLLRDRFPDSLIEL